VCFYYYYYYSPLADQPTKTLYIGTVLCYGCGAFNMHPRSAGGKEIAGSLFCGNLACPLGGMFFNRDLSASLNIGCRYGGLGVGYIRV